MTLTIKIRRDGPDAAVLATGESLLMDHEAQPISLPEPKPGNSTITLCRCGPSTRKPFCEGTHSKIGFEVPSRPSGVSKPRPQRSRIVRYESSAL